MKKVDAIKGTIVKRLEDDIYVKKSDLYYEILDTRYAKNNKKRYKHLDFVEAYMMLLDGEQISESDIGGIVYVYSTGTSAQVLHDTYDVLSKNLAKTVVATTDALFAKYGYKKLSKVIDLFMAYLKLNLEDRYSYSDVKTVEADFGKSLSKSLGIDDLKIDDLIYFLMQGRNGQYLVEWYESLVTGEGYVGYTKEAYETLTKKEAEAETKDYTANDWAKLVKGKIESLIADDVTVTSKVVGDELVADGYDAQKVKEGMELLAKAGYNYHQDREVKQVGIIKNLYGVWDGKKYSSFIPEQGKDFTPKDDDDDFKLKQDVNNPNYKTFATKGNISDVKDDDTEVKSIEAKRKETLTELKESQGGLVKTLNTMANAGSLEELEQVYLAITREVNQAYDKYRKGEDDSANNAEFLAIMTDTQAKIMGLISKVKNNNKGVK